MTALPCAYLVAHARGLLAFLLGDGYEAAHVAFSLMLVYTAYQSLGQIFGTMLFATAMTGRYAAVSVATNLAGIPLAYVLMAPGGAFLPGLGLGAGGAALKTLVLAFAAVNVQSLMIARGLGARFEFSYQVKALAFLTLAAFGAREAVDSFFAFSGVEAHPLVAWFFSGVVYVLASGVAVYLFPGAMGMTREAMRGYLRTSIRQGKKREALLE